MRRYLGLLVLLTFGLAAPGVAHAATYYTSPAGAGTDCTQPQPCELQQGFIKAGAADTLRVGPGDYTAALTGTTATETVIGVPSERARPTIRMTGTLQLDKGATFLDVRGDVAGPLVSLPNNAAPSSNLDVRNDGTVGCSATGTDLTNALCFGTQTGLIGLDVGLYGVTAIGTTTGIGCTSDQCSLTNVIARGNTQDLLVASGANVAATTSAFTTKAGAGPVAGSPVTGAPAFQPGTYRPVTAAATIDAGSTGTGVGGLDLDFNTRIIGSNPDIGAYERVAAVPTVVTGTATGVSETGATLHATVTTNGGYTTWSWTPAGGAAIPGAFATGDVPPYDATLAVTGLQPGTTYRYDLVATNDAGASTPVTIAVTTAGTAPATTGGGTPTTTTSQPATTVPPAKAVRFKVTRPSNAAARKLVRKGTTAKVKVTCPAACSARIKGEVRAGKQRLGKIAVPAKALKIGAGGTGTLNLITSKALRKKVKAYKRKHPKAKLRLVLTVTTTSPGATSRSTTLRVVAD